MNGPLTYDECNCFALRQAARFVTQIYERHLGEVGLTAAQFTIMAKLARRAPATMVEMADAMVMDRTTLGRAVRPLERDKLLAIGGDDDGRKRRLQLTASGQARLKAATAKWREAQKEFELAFGVPDAASLRTTLQRVVAAT